MQDSNGQGWTFGQSISEYMERLLEQSIPDVPTMLSRPGHYRTSLSTPRITQIQIKIIPSDPPLRADPVCEQSSVLDVATYGLAADLQQRRRLSDRQKRLKDSDGAARAGRAASLGTRAAGEIGLNGRCWCGLRRLFKIVLTLHRLLSRLPCDLPRRDGIQLQRLFSVMPARRTRSRSLRSVAHNVTSSTKSWSRQSAQWP